MFEENSNTGGLGKRTTDPNKKKTWDIAKKLGVVQELNLARIYGKEIVNYVPYIKTVFDN